MIDADRPDLYLVARGVPATAGNKTAFAFVKGWHGPGKPILGVRVVEGGKNAASKLKVEQWRNAIAAATLEQVLGRSPRPAPLDGPLLAWADFYLPRPKTARAPWPTGKPDWSKLIRALEDPIVRPVKDYPGLIADDARIVFAMGGKFYAEAGSGPLGPRAELRVWRVDVRPSMLRSAVADAWFALAASINDHREQVALL